MYELLPFWHTLFSRLGFEVVVSPFSNRKLYQSGQATIPSDTACFPAKLSHGHIHWLCEQGVDAIFYPCMSYNLDEHLGDNHYNCPVVAYYPEVLEGNCPELKATKFIYDYFNLERRKDFYKKFQQTLDHYFPGLDRKAVHEAIDAAYDEYARHMQQLRDKGTEIIAQARREGRRIIVLAGRPYHVDPEVNHGIDQLIIRQGAAVISEDSVSWHEQKFQTSVLNQWTYHSRLYAAAKYCTENPDMDLVQLVSFGCGLDAVTTDETREILQAGSKLYTQLKIDEITNLGAVNIRLRSLFAALEERKEDKSKSSLVKGRWPSPRGRRDSRSLAFTALLPSLPLHLVHQLLPSRKRPRVLHRRDGNALQCRPREKCLMARHHYIRETHQNRHDLVLQNVVREVLEHLPVLGLVDIQPHARKFAGPQRVDQRVGVDQPTAARVDKNRVVTHHFDGVSVDHVVGFRCQRAVQTDKVCRAQQFIQLHIAHNAVQRRVPVLVVGQHRHAKPVTDARHGRADAPRAHNARRRAVQVVPQQTVQRKVVVAHLDIRLADAPVRGLRQRHSVLGHGLRAVARHAQHRDAAFLRRSQVHIIVPRATAAASSGCPPAPAFPAPEPSNPH